MFQGTSQDCVNKDRVLPPRRPELGYAYPLRPSRGPERANPLRPAYGPEQVHSEPARASPRAGTG
eukprot:3160126-Alexandrium_andersonii.AAC.1